MPRYRPWTPIFDVDLKYGDQAAPGTLVGSLNGIATPAAIQVAISIPAATAIVPCLTATSLTKEGVYASPSSTGPLNTPRCAAVAANSVAVVTEFNGLTSIDASDPTNPVLLDYLLAPDPFAGVDGLAVQYGDYVYTSNGSYITVTDVSTPSAAFVAANISPTWSADAIALTGDYLIVLSHGGVVDSYDLSSTPLDPQLVDTLADVVVLGAGSFTVIGHDGTHLAAAMFIGNTTRVAIIDISDPTNLALLGYTDQTVATAQTMTSIIVDGNYCYGPIANSIAANSKFVTIDISTPTAPAFLGSVTSSNFDGSGGAAKSGTNVFVAAAGRTMTVDVSTPASPTLTTTLSNANIGLSPRAALLNGNYFYSASQGSDRVAVIDVTTPGSLSYVTSLTHADFAGGPTALVLSGTDLFVIVTGLGVATFGRFVTADVTTASAPSYVSTIDPLEYAILYGARDVAVSGDYAYVTAANASGMAVVDISDPAAMTFAGFVQDATQLNLPRGLAVVGGYAYVTSFQGDSLTVIDVSTPTSPTIVGFVTHTNLNGAQAVAVQGNYAYVTASVASPARLTVVDISTPASPSVVGSVSNSTLAGAAGVVVDGNYAYVAAPTNDRITVIDVTTPTAPAFAASVSSAQLDNVQYLVKQGTRLFCPNGPDDRVTIVDVTTPTSPSVVNQLIDTTDLDNCIGIAVNDNYLYVAVSSFTPSGRLTVLELVC